MGRVKLKLKHSDFLKKQKEKMDELNGIRKRRKKWTGSRNLWSALIHQRGEKCEKCGNNNFLTLHHIKSREDGGAWYELDNLLILCRACHAKVHGTSPRGMPFRRKSSKVRDLSRLIRKYKYKWAKYLVGK